MNKCRHTYIGIDIHNDRDDTIIDIHDDRHT